MLQTIFRNLISNAVKFTHRGGYILISAVTTEEHFTLLSVKDSGIGIPRETLTKLFRIDANHKTRGTEGELSTGLGLILCKEFVERHEGKIWVESEPGKGSSFYFTLNAITS
jgi:signal transduction histidine kinase